MKASIAASGATRMPSQNNRFIRAPSHPGRKGRLRASFQKSAICVTAMSPRKQTSTSAPGTRRRWW
jgi:hypothetical protein